MRFITVKKLFSLLLFLLLLLTLLSCSETPPFEVGKTAYEIAVENGFVGTEEEWLESLKGIEKPYITDVKVQNGNVIVTFNDGTQQSLGALLLETAGPLSFLPLPDDTYAVMAASTDITGSVTVPAEYRGKPVAHVLHRAFASCTYLFSLTLPDSITVIGEEALRGCDNLTDLTLPYLGASVDDATAAHLGYLFGARDPAENGKYVPTSLATLTLTGGTTLEAFAFSGCEHIKSITLPDSLTSIAEAALADCKGLTELVLPFIGSTPSDTLSTHIGYLFGATSYAEHSTAVPATLASIRLTGTTALARYAFFGCYGLRKIYLPETLTAIGQYAFGACSLTEAHLGVTDGWQTAEGDPIVLGTPLENAAMLCGTLRAKDWQCGNN